jgi:hypothetical protein
MRRNRLSAKCPTCGLVFERPASLILRNEERGKSTYCSRRCHYDGRMKHPVETFMENWHYDEGCWRWTGSWAMGGYGVMRTESGAGPRRTVAHRFAFECMEGRPVLDGHELHHVCENPWCVNPMHLVEVTRREHMEIDGRIKGYWLGRKR